MGRAPGRNGNSRRVSGGLRASRGEASGPSDPKGRKSNNLFPPKAVGFGLSPIPRSRYAAWATRLAPLRVAEAPHPFTAPFSEVRPRRAPHAPLKRRSRRERRFLTESRYSLLTYSSSPPAESSNELRRVAVRRVGWRRTARLKEPQELGPKPGQQLSPIHCPNLSPMLGPARHENRLRFSCPKSRHGPKHYPVSASLRLRCRSAAFAVARGNSCRIGRVPTGRICPFKQAGDGVFAHHSFFARLGKSCQNAPAHFDDFPL